MTTALTLSTRELRHKKRENAADRNLEYFKSGMNAIKPIITSKPFLAIGGSIILYKLEQANKIDGVSAGLFSGALLAWMASDVITGTIDALLPG